MSEIQPNKVGNPSKKTNERIAALLRLTLEGKTEKEIAEIIGVHTSTIFRWKQWDPELCIAINELKQEADQAVKTSLFKKAIGFERKIEQQAVTKDGDVIDYTETVYVPPSDTSIIFWLKNRDPERWKDRREEEHKVLMVKQEIITKLSNEELLEETKRLVLKLEAVSVQSKVSEE